MLFPVLFALNNALVAPSFDFFVGTYTSPSGSQGIYRVTLNTETGALSEPVLAATAKNPSYLAVDKPQRMLFAVNESAHGEVGVFHLDAKHFLTPAYTLGTQGRDPCHISISPDGHTAFAANYSSGSVMSYLVQSGATQGFTNSGSGPNHDRQEASHMHSIQVDPLARFCLAADLGTDELLAFPVGQSGAVNLADPVRNKVTPGSGPRHLDFSGDGRTVYVANELTDTVGVYRVESAAGKLQEIQEIPMLPTGVSTGGTTAAEIFVHPNGRWLYASTRGYDSLVCYSIEGDGRLKLVDSHKLSVHIPRGFAIDPSGKWIVVGGQNSNDLLSLKLNGATGAIESEAFRVALSSPVSITFLR